VFRCSANRSKAGRGETMHSASQKAGCDPDEDNARFDRGIETAGGTGDLVICKALVERKLECEWLLVSESVG
jgi:hypothetical protein